MPEQIQQDNREQDSANYSKDDFSGCLHRLSYRFAKAVVNLKANIDRNIAGVKSATCPAS